MKVAVFWVVSKAPSWAGETHHQGARTEGQPSPQGPRSTSLGSYKLGNTDTEVLCLCVWLHNDQETAIKQRSFTEIWAQALSRRY